MIGQQLTRRCHPHLVSRVPFFQFGILLNIIRGIEFIQYQQRKHLFINLILTGEKTLHQTSHLHVERGEINAKLHVRIHQILSQLQLALNRHFRCLIHRRRGSGKQITQRGTQIIYSAHVDRGIIWRTIPPDTSPRVQHKLFINQITQREQVIPLFNLVLPEHIQLVIFPQSETQITTSHRFQNIPDRGVKNNLHFQIIIDLDISIQIKIGNQRNTFFTRTTPSIRLTIVYKMQETPVFLRQCRS